MNYEQETRKLIRHLRANGCTPRTVDYGGGPVARKTEAEFIDLCTATDWCRLTSTHDETGIEFTALLVYGNDPGELVADWTEPGDIPDILNDLFMEFSDACFEIANR